MTLALAGALAACSGADDSTGPTTPPPTSPPAASLSLAATPAAVRVQAGQSGTATLRLTRGGPAAAVALGASVAGAPAGVAAAFAPATVPADAAESAVTLTTTAATPAGDYAVTISGAGDASASTTLTLHVDPAPVAPPPVARYTLAVAPAPVAVTAGAAAASATVTLARSHFAGAVALAAAGAPAGLAVTVPGAPVAGDSAALGVQAAASVPAGDYPVTLTGSAAGLAPGDRHRGRARRRGPAAPAARGRHPGVRDRHRRRRRGRPLAGVRVYAKNTLLYNTNAIGVTDAQGRYRLDVREPMGTWRVTAQLRREYEGHTYTLDLHPENDEPAPFAGVDGAVRNFSWRVSGRTPSGGYYGGRVYVSGIPGGWMNDVEHEDLELEFTPVGPLIDGSVGARAPSGAVWAPRPTTCRWASTGSPPGPRRPGPAAAGRAPRQRRGRAVRGRGGRDLARRPQRLGEAAGVRRRGPPVRCGGAGTGPTAARWRAAGSRAPPRPAPAAAAARRPQRRRRTVRRRPLRSSAADVARPPRGSGPSATVPPRGGTRREASRTRAYRRHRSSRASTVVEHHRRAEAERLESLRLRGGVAHDHVGHRRRAQVARREALHLRHRQRVDHGLLAPRLVDGQAVVGDRRQVRELGARRLERARPPPGEGAPGHLQVGRRVRRPELGDDRLRQLGRLESGVRTDRTHDWNVPWPTPPTKRELMPYVYPFPSRSCCVNRDAKPPPPRM
jgi:hypothetical protein